MNKALIKNWNSVVSYDDEVYHMGDVSFGTDKDVSEFIHSLNGKIYLIKGNHEKPILSKESNRKRFEWIKDYHELDVSNRAKMCMFHYPIGSWNKSHHGSLHVHGHCHNSFAPVGRMMDVGVDNPIVNFTPIELDRVVEMLSSISHVQVDHHV
jgi:calcineurin-like phosphoesterase family protein